MTDRIVARPHRAQVRRRLILATAALLFGSPTFAQVPAASADPAKVAYLNASEVVSGPVTGGLAFRFPAAFYRSRLILLGESHGSAAPQVVDLELLTHLSRLIGLRDYLAEVDAVQAERLNAFLGTGDEAALQRVFAFWKPDAQWGNTAFLAKVRGVRALNAALPPARRIRFHGVDAVQDWPLLAEWLAGQGATLDVAAVAAEKTASGKAVLALAALASARPSPMRDRLAASLALTRDKAGRERTIFENYARLVRTGELGDRPAYGLWGLFHVMQAGINGAKPFAMQIKASDLPAAKSVATVVLLSLDSAVMIPMGAKKMRMTSFNIDGPVVKVAGAPELRAASRPDAVTVFDLTRRGSPYLTAPDFTAITTTIGQNFKPDDPAAPATVFAQYIGVFRGSDWAAPLP